VLQLLDATDGLGYRRQHHGITQLAGWVLQHSCEQEVGGEWRVAVGVLL
jgi:hypothetical protein